MSRGIVVTGGCGGVELQLMDVFLLGVQALSGKSEEIRLELARQLPAIAGR